jgi:AraC-like DNA-binding protein
MPTSLSDELHVRVLVAERVSIDSTWDSRNVYSSFWRLYCNAGGDAAIRWSGGLYPLPASRVHLIPAWVRFDCVNREQIKNYYIHFELVGLPPAIVRELFDSPITLSPRSEAERSAHRWQKAVNRPGALDAIGLCQTKQLVYAALSETVAGLTPANQARCTRHVLHHSAITPALEYIDQHLGDSIGSTDLADVCGYGTGHLIRLFKTHLNQTPGQYLLDRRTSAAAMRLIFTDEKIEKIATACGFRDRFYFSRVFARRMGTSPAEYRKTGKV